MGLSSVLCSGTVQYFPMVCDELSKSDEKYILAVGSHPDPVVTTTEIANEIEVSQQAVYNKFEKFQELGLMRSKKPGARSKVWWLTTDGKDCYSELKS